MSVQAYCVRRSCFSDSMYDLTMQTRVRVRADPHASAALRVHTGTALVSMPMQPVPQTVGAVTRQQMSVERMCLFANVHVV